MTNQVNEFSIDLPMSPVSATVEPISYSMNSGYATSPVGIMSTDGDDTSIAIGDATAQDVNPTSPTDPSNITIFPGNITLVSYDEKGPIACFDVVFTVGTNCDGVSNTYQVVKRIGIDKVKIAAQAMASTPMSVVESIKPVDPDQKLVIKLEYKLDGKDMVQYFHGKKSKNYFWNASIKNAEVFDSSAEANKMIDELAREDANVYDNGKFKEKSGKRKLTSVLLKDQSIKESQQTKPVISDVQKFRRLAGLD